MSGYDIYFQGKLVRLTSLRPEDAAIMAAWSNNYEFLRMLDTDYVRPISAEEYAEKEKTRYDATSMEFRIRTLAEDKLIGFVGIHTIEWNNQAGHLSIGIGEPDYWNRGYGTDALRVALRYAFGELNLYRVGLDVIAYNERAIRAYEKVGFRQEGAARQQVLRNGQRYDLVYMGILKNELILDE
jgi:RimJ/RimL family protein N-acetyltransferase